MRLFLSLQPDEPTRETLAAWAEESSVLLPRARPLSSGNLHLTLEFLGERDGVERRRIAGCTEAVASRHPSLRLSFAELLVLPVRGRSKIAGIGMAADTQLTRLHEDLQRELDRTLRREASQLRFRPHITLLRTGRPGWRRSETSTWRAQESPVQGQAFEVTYIDLMKSRLTASGAEYSVVHRFALEK